MSALSLGRIHLAPEIVVPALVSSLNDPRPEVRRLSALAIGDFGDKAKPYIYELVEHLNDPNVEVREAVTSVLRACTSTNWIFHFH